MQVFQGELATSVRFGIYFFLKYPENHCLLPITLFHHLCYFTTHFFQLDILNTNCNP
jgi:hypothetical protein